MWHWQEHVSYHSKDKLAKSAPFVVFEFSFVPDETRRNTKYMVPFEIACVTADIGDYSDVTASTVLKLLII